MSEYETENGTAPAAGVDTIAAISTPAGRGGIGIVRLSGPEAASIVAQLVLLRAPLEHARARLADVLDESGKDGEAERIDEAVVTYFAAPNSYTAEDVVEIAAHGSPVVLDLLLRRALALGARLAEPGEFTQRAFLAGKLDLTQAEAVRDFVSRDLFVKILANEEEHIDYLEKQFDLIKLMGIQNYVQLQSKAADEEGATTGD